MISEGESPLLKGTHNSIEMADHREGEAHRILMLIIGALVDDPDAVVVEVSLGEDATTFRVAADPQGMSLPPLLLGNQGRTARSIRTVMVAMGVQARWQYHLEMDGDLTDPDGPVD